jgi:hypothetical protein
MNTMKILKMLSLGLVLVITSSCQLDQWENITLNPGASIALSASGTSVVLTKEKEGQEAFTLTWPKPDFGFEAAPNYTIYMDKTGGSFSAPVAINVQGSNSKTFKTEELNKHLLNLKFVPGQSGTLIVKVEAQLGAKKLISEIQNIQVTAYSAFLDLTTSWGVVGSGYNNWGQFPDAPFYTSKTPNVIVAYVTLKDGEIKFRENNKWDNNVGDNGKDGTLEKNGDNIPVTAGNYKITFNTLNNTYTIVPYSWGIVGSAYNNWGETPDFNFVYDDASDQWRALVQLKTGEFKIRKNSDWSVNYGDTGKNGSLEAGGDNIPVTAGKYQITYNENDLTIEIKSIPNIWGLVGSAYNNWGATADAQFNRDWRNDGVWILKNVTLLNGEFKFRDGNAWDLNYGDSGNNGSLEQNGDNIAATEGVYTITLDFSNPNAPTWRSVKY